MIMEINEVIDSILNGEFDGQEDKIKEALSIRKDIGNKRKFIEISVGDTVRFNHLTRPNYLQGIEAKVIRKNRAKLVVRISREEFGARRFAGIETTTSVSLVDLVEKTEV
jgi:hypothetical protein